MSSIGALSPLIIWVLAGFVALGCGAEQGQEVHSSSTSASFPLGEVPQSYFLKGEASNGIAAVQWILFRDISKWPELVEHVAPNTDVLYLGQILPQVSCAGILRLSASHVVDSDSIRHRSFGNNDDVKCPAIILDEILGFDLVIVYADATCFRKPSITVGEHEGKMSFFVDGSDDRGGCDTSESGFAIGFTLTDIAGVGD